MKHQQLPENWNCMIASLAMLLDLPYEQIEKHIPYKWDAPVFYDGQPLGIHVEQLQYIAHNYNWILVPYVQCVKYNPTDRDFYIAELQFIADYEKMLATYDGLLLGSYKNDIKQLFHAVVWNHQEGKIYDPARRIIERSEFDVDSFYAGIQR